MSRLQPPDRRAFTAEQNAVHDDIVKGPRSAVPAPLALWLHRPGLAGPAQALGAYARYGTALPPRLSELAIIVTAAFWKAEYEWSVHASKAIEEGIAREAVAAIKRGEQPSFDREDEAVVFEVAYRLHRDHVLSDQLYGRAVGLLGDAALVDLVGILGYYTLISMTINVFEVAPPTG